MRHGIKCVCVNFIKKQNYVYSFQNRWSGTSNNHIVEIQERIIFFIKFVDKEREPKGF